MSAFELIQPGVNELRKTLRFTLAAAHQPAADLERQVTGFLEYARALSLDPGRHWLVRSDGRTICGITCLESPGRTAMLFIPARACEADVEGTIRGLVEMIASEEASRGIRLLQALVDPEDSTAERLLRRCGFVQIAVLDYLECRLPATLSATRPQNGSSGETWTWAEYDETGTHDQFADLIRQTYDGSLDCPGLSAIRSIEDVIASHKGAGLFSPRRWRMLCVGGRPAGCILLSQNPLRPAAELVYMGVAPAFRGRGLGRHILDAGLDMAHSDGFASVTLAVDRDNLPARRLYESSGFAPINARRAMLRATSPA